MSDGPLVMGTERAIAFQNNIEGELGRRGYDADQTMAEYIAIMVINNKTADQINAELSDLIGPEYDPDFSTWLFSTAKGAPAPAPAPSPPPAAIPSKASRLVSQAFDAVSSGASTGTKRAFSPARDGGPNKARKVDAPSAPRAMRETDSSPAPTSPVISNGEGSNSKSLLQRIETFDSRGGFAPRDRGRGGFRDRNDRQHFRQNQNQNQNQPQLPVPTPAQMPGFVDPAQFAMMDPAMMMGMNMQMNPMAFQEIIGNNMAMMQQMASMMMTMHQQHQQPQPNAQAPAAPQQNGASSGGVPFKPTSGASSSLSAGATPFQPTIYVQDKPASTAICKHGVKCNNARCRDSHPSPVATAESGVVLSTEVCDKGPGGSECKDQDCTQSHISPAATKPGLKVSFVSSNGAGKPTPSATPATASTTGAAPQPASKPTPTPTTAPPANQLPIPCKFGAHCTRPGCHFKHPNRRGGGGLANSGTPCRFGAKCTRVDCSFSHPPGRTLPNQFHKGLSTSTKASQIYQPAPHRSVVFNVAKKGGEEGKVNGNGAATVATGDEKEKKGEENVEEKEVESVV